VVNFLFACAGLPSDVMRDVKSSYTRSIHHTPIFLVGVVLCMAANRDLPVVRRRLVAIATDRTMRVEQRRGLVTSAIVKGFG
jgi:hypothetical protein